MTVERKYECEAIAEGTRQAINERMAGITPELILDAIAAGMEQAIAGAMENILDSSEVLEAITAGVFQAFDQVYATNILDAIENGTKAALER